MTYASQKINKDNIGEEFRTTKIVKPHGGDRYPPF